jgi:hypothetical protein
MNMISSYCHVRNNQIIVDGVKHFESEPSLSFVDFSALAFRFLGVAYPKFYKMDHLCKLALITSEYLLRGDPAFAAAGPANTGIVLSTRGSSIESDRAHAASINNKTAYFPSPAVFVYTLANIMIGEISIRNRITGENACFVSETFNSELNCTYVNQLLDTGLIKACLCGWVELNGPDYEAFLYLVLPFNGTRKSSNFNEQSPTYINDLRGRFKG